VDRLQEGVSQVLSPEAVLSFLESKGMFEAKEQLLQILENERMSAGAESDNVCASNQDPDRWSSAESQINKNVHVIQEICIQNSSFQKAVQTNLSDCQQTVDTSGASLSSSNSLNRPLSRSNSLPGTSLMSTWTDNRERRRALTADFCNDKLIVTCCRHPAFSDIAPQQLPIRDSTTSNPMGLINTSMVNDTSLIERFSSNSTLACISKEIEDAALAVAIASSEMTHKEESRANAQRPGALRIFQKAKTRKSDSHNSATICRLPDTSHATHMAQHFHIDNPKDTEWKSTENTAAMQEAEDYATSMAIVSSEMDAKVLIHAHHNQIVTDHPSDCDHTSQNSNDAISTSSNDISSHASVASVYSNRDIENAMFNSEPTATVVEYQTVQAELVNAIDAVLVQKNRSLKFLSSRKNQFLVAGLIVLLVIIISVAIAVPISKRKHEPLEPYSTEERRQLILEAILPLTNEEWLVNNSTAQCNVLSWLVNEMVVRADNQVQLQQRFALGVIYHSLRGPNWVEEYGFLAPKHECAWTQIALQCDSSGNVVTLNLAQNGLSGSIPREILGLKYLKELRLDFNRINGGFPDYLADITTLEVISLSNNQLTGLFPENIYDLDLQYLDVSENMLEGTIPPTAYELPKLNFWSIHHNNFTGTISPDIGKLKNVRSISLFRNQIHGTIPSEIGQLSLLENLQISDNHLVGTIPSELGSLEKLWRVSLSYNDITGEVPRSFVHLKSLWRLYLQSTFLEGDVTFLCERFPSLDVFRVDLDEVTCPCCTCCE